MNVSRLERQQAVWQMERVNMQFQREEEYRKLIEKRNFDEIVAERVRRNIRLDSDKGTHFDAEV